MPCFDKIAWLPFVLVHVKLWCSKNRMKSRE